MPPTTSLMRPQPTLPEGVQQDALTAATAPVISTVFELPLDWNGPPTLYDWEIVFPVTPATVSIQLEGSDDPSFPGGGFILDGPKTTTTPEKRFIVDKPVRYIRVNLTAITGALASVTARLKNTGKQ